MRYTGEVRLRVIGDYAQASTQIPRARTLLGALWERDKSIGGLFQSHMRRTFSDGVYIEAGYIAEQAYILIDVTGGVVESAPVTPLLVSRWAPEGLLLTPRTLANPDGWGGPWRTHEATGQRTAFTAGAPGHEGGPLPQVLLNRFENNLYFDRLDKITGLPDGVNPAAAAPERLRESYEADAPVAKQVTLPLHHVTYSYGVAPGTPYDQAQILPEPGLYDGAVGPADKPFGALLLAQTEMGEVSGVWQAHRPEELLYPTLVEEGIFQHTNALRTAVGEARVTRQLRGDANSASLGAREMYSSPLNYFGHSHPEWTPGYRTAAGRIMNATGYALFGEFVDNPSENVLTYSVGFYPGTLTQLELGAELAEAWEASPDHYPNMVSANWTASTSWPVHNWAPQGTVGAQMHAAGYGITDFELSWDSAASSSTVWATTPVNLTQQIAWAQVFTAREAWLPVYDRVRDWGRQRAGVFNGANPHNRDYNRNAPRVGVGRTIYTLPDGNRVAVGVDDDFLCVAGCGLFEKDGAPWVRMVYWESSDGLQTPPIAGADYLTLNVVVFPEGLLESGSMPWRPDNQPEMLVEFTQTFLAADRWLPTPENVIHFDSQGGRFVFELERICEGGVTEGLAATDGLMSTDFSADIYTAGYAIGSVERVAMVYDSLTAAVTPLLPTQQPLEVQVNAWTIDPGTNQESLYERTLVGQYKVWPYFDAFDNIQFITLDINEYQYQRGPLGQAGYDVNTAAYAWRVRKMLFPSGKEVTYMQQYMWVHKGVEFDPEARPLEWVMFPGTGENFYAVVHYLDEAAETLIYSKHGSISSAGEGGFSQDQFYTDGDSTYLLDAFTGVERVVEQMAFYPRIDPADYPGLIDVASWADRRAADVPVWTQGISLNQPLLKNAEDIYRMELTPFALRTRFSAGGASPNVYAFTWGHSLPRAVGWGTAFTAATAAGSYLGFIPAANYKASCFAGRDYLGESSATMDWVERAQAGRSPYCGFTHNISPLFSRRGEVSAKFVEYDGRWVARLQVWHINNTGWQPPPMASQPRNSSSDYPLSDWTYRTPPDAVTEFGDSAIHLRSNFDIDEAVGIADVYDVEPFGRV